MSVQRNMSDLMKEVKAIGRDHLVQATGRGNKVTKDDVCRVLRQFFLERDYPNGQPYVPVLNPMLCARYEELEDKYLDVTHEIWKDNSEWVLNEKLNGCRMTLYLRPDGVYVDSRNISVKTYRNEEYHNHLLFKDYVAPFTATLDCEVKCRKSRIDTSVNGRIGVVTESELQATTALLAMESTASKQIQVSQEAELEFIVFDLIEYNGKKITHLPLRDRLSLLQSVILPKITAEVPWFKEVDWVYEGKREYVQRLLAQGKEGAVAKKLSSVYMEQDSRSHRSWVKIKRTLETDAFVCGWVPASADSGWTGLIGGLQLGVFLTDEEGNKISDQPHVIAAVSNITYEERVKISVKGPDGNLALDPSWYGRVCEVVGQAVSARKNALTHARVSRWREGADGKAAEDCTFPQSLLLANIL